MHTDTRDFFHWCRMDCRCLNPRTFGYISCFFVLKYVLSCQINKTYDIYLLQKRKKSRLKKTTCPVCSCEALGVGPWWQGGDACSSFPQCLNCLAASALALATMGWFLGKQPEEEYFYYHMDGLWWWEVDYEWWYFDEARPTAQKLVVFGMHCRTIQCAPGKIGLVAALPPQKSGKKQAGKHVMSEELDRQSLEQSVSLCEVRAKGAFKPTILARLWFKLLATRISHDLCSCRLACTWG